MNMPAENLRHGPDLQQLLDGIADAPAIALSGLTSDSRRLLPGDLFVALSGIGSHGLDYLDQAIEAGAVAVIHDGVVDIDEKKHAGLPLVCVPDLAAQLGTIADRWFAAPSASMRVTGVTGTNGKTTVAFLIAQCLQILDRKCAYIGTLGSGMAELHASSGMTTPACIDLHRELAEFRDSGARYVALEVSSHALVQRRVDGVRFDAAIFTNLSRDHIDYHGDMAAYGEAKAKLFLDTDARYRIVNVDTEFGAVTVLGQAALRVDRKLPRRPAARPIGRNEDVGQRHHRDYYEGGGKPGGEPGKDSLGCQFLLRRLFDLGSRLIRGSFFWRRCRFLRGRLSSGFHGRRLRRGGSGLRLGGGRFRCGNVFATPTADHGLRRSSADTGAGGCRTRQQPRGNAQ